VYQFESTFVEFVKIRGEYILKYSKYHSALILLTITLIYVILFQLRLLWEYDFTRLLDKLQRRNAISSKRLIQLWSRETTDITLASNDQAVRWLYSFSDRLLKSVGWCRFRNLKFVLLVENFRKKRGRERLKRIKSLSSYLSVYLSFLYRRGDIYLASMSRVQLS